MPVPCRARARMVTPAEVMDAEQLASQGKATLGETIEHLPGVRGSSFGAGVSRPVIRGMDGAWVKVLSDGIYVLDASTLSADHAVTTEPLLLQQIEVLKGPATLLYGGGAVGGVVNLVDRKIPTQLPEQGHEVQLGWQATTEAGSIPGLSAQRNARSRDHMLSFFIEDNIELNDTTLLTPGLRYDKHSVTGGNWSPALNLSHEFAPDWTVKAGIARAYKAPNLYQTNPNYLLYSRGIGCWGAAGACYLQGNKDLKAETSVNKELGLEYAGDGLVAGLTWFHNSYRNKVEAGTVVAGWAVGGSTPGYANADIFTWENVPRAVIEGLEGTFNLALTPSLYWSNNLTWMLQSKNKSTGESLSIIPEFTLNSRLEWQTTDALNLHTHVTWYGKQTPNKYDYQGKRMSGEEQSQLSPYVLAGVGGRYVLNEQLSFTGGIDNLFNKRLYRRGNAVGVGDPRTIYGTGAATYNEPGRSFYASATYAF